MGWSAKRVLGLRRDRVDDFHLVALIPQMIPCRIYTDVEYLFRCR